MCSETSGGHPELWVVNPPLGQGPEGNLEMWREAEKYLSFLCDKAEAAGESEGGDGALCALVDAYNRCIQQLAVMLQQ